MPLGSPSAMATKPAMASRMRRARSIAKGRRPQTPSARWQPGRTARQPRSLLPPMRADHQPRHRKARAGEMDQDRGDALALRDRGPASEVQHRIDAGRGRSPGSSITSRMSQKAGMSRSWRSAGGEEFAQHLIGLQRHRASRRRAPPWRRAGRRGWARRARRRRSRQWRSVRAEAGAAAARAFASSTPPIQIAATAKVTPPTQVELSTPATTTRTKAASRARLSRRTRSDSSSIASTTQDADAMCCGTQAVWNSQPAKPVAGMITESMPGM